MTRRSTRSIGTTDLADLLERLPYPPDKVGDLARLHTLSLAPRPPAPLLGYALGAHGMATLHVGAEDKVAFEGLRTRLREELGFPVTQPGAFAAMVRFVGRRERSFVGACGRMCAV